MLVFRAVSTCHYREYAPHPALANNVQCYWSVRVGNSRNERITSRGLSKGHVDLVFATGGAFCELAEQWLGQTGNIRCYLVGPLQEAALAHSTSGLFAVGIKMRPGWAFPLLRTPCHELIGCRATAQDIWPEATSSYLEQVADADSAEQRLRLLEQLLLKRGGRTNNENRNVCRALELISTTRGRTSIDGVLAGLDVGARQLEREFHRQVGLTPRRMSQIVRIQHALELARGQSKPSWSRIAFECGFFDQAHFIRQFKSVTGLSPNAYLSEATVKLSET